MWNSVFWAHPQGCATLTMVLGHFCQPPQKKPHTQPSPLLQAPDAPAPHFTFCRLPVHLPGFPPPMVTESNPGSLPAPRAPLSAILCVSVCLTHLKYPKSTPSPTPKLPLLYICPSQLMATQGENLPKPLERPPSLPSPYPQGNIQKPPGSLPVHISLQLPPSL